MAVRFGLVYKFAGRVGYFHTLIRYARLLDNWNFGRFLRVKARPGIFDKPTKQALFYFEEGKMKHRTTRDLESWILKTRRQN